MKSIKNTDIESTDWREKLENHLKNEDFFHVDSFPYVILNIKKYYLDIRTLLNCLKIETNYEVSTTRFNILT